MSHDAGKIKLKDIDDKLLPKLFKAMGMETANVHLPLTGQGDLLEHRIQYTASMLASNSSKVLEKLMTDFLMPLLPANHSLSQKR